MVELFQTTKQNVSLHVSNVFKEGELDQESTVKEYLTVQQEGKRAVSRQVKYYNLDVIISVGYRVKSKRGVQFRQWANNAGIIYYSVTVLLLNCLANGNRLLDSEAPIKIISSAASHM